MVQAKRSWDRSDTMLYLTVHVTGSLILWDGIIRESLFAAVLGYLLSTFTLCHALWTAGRITGCADMRGADEREVDKGQR